MEKEGEEKKSYSKFIVNYLDVDIITWELRIELPRIGYFLSYYCISLCNFHHSSNILFVIFCPEQ